MSTVILEVQVLPGTDIKTACEDVFKFHQRIGVDVSFNFNGMLVTTINKGVKEMIDDYLQSIKNNREKIC